MNSAEIYTTMGMKMVVLLTFIASYQVLSTLAVNGITLKTIATVQLLIKDTPKED